jgi:hypothetical protein
MRQAERPVVEGGHELRRQTPLSLQRAHPRPDDRRVRVGVSAGPDRGHDRNLGARSEAKKAKCRDP